MTTLRDLLKDFAHEIHKQTQVDSKGETYMIDVDEEDIIDEYIDLIKERLIG